jgi:undecaprenyl-diphosphatase
MFKRIAARFRSGLMIPLLALAAAAGVHAADVWQLDRYDEREDRGIFSRSNQKRIDALAITAVVGLSLWEGTDTRLGRTAWQATDAALMSAAATETAKRLFRRPRPADNHDPSIWFAGSRNRSFPSGEVAMMAAFVTPFIREYHHDYPAAWALAVLPAYMADARMASQGHWLTDVLAGAAIGTAAGLYATHRDVPLVLSVTRHGGFVGLRKQF